MTITVRLPASLRPLADAQKQLALEARSIAEVIDQLATKYPKLGSSLPGRGPRRFVQVFVNGEDVRTLDGLETPVRQGDVVELVSAVAGG